MVIVYQVKRNGFKLESSHCLVAHKDRAINVWIVNVPDLEVNVSVMLLQLRVFDWIQWARK